MNAAPIVFLAFSNDEDAHLALLKQEAWDISQALREPHQREFIQIARHQSAELDEIYDTLSVFKDRVAIFHYGGHANGTALRLEDGAAGARGLAALLGEQRNLQLVFLNGCGTLPQVDALLAAGVKAVVATSVPIEDAKAAYIAARFYGHLSEGRTIGGAFKLARKDAQKQFGELPGPAIATRSFDAMPLESEGVDLPWQLHVAPQGGNDALNWKLPSRSEAGPSDAPVVSLMFSRDGGQYEDVLDEESAALRTVLGELDKKGHIEVAVEETPDPAVVRKTVSNLGARLAIFHYAGYDGGPTLPLQAEEGAAEDLAFQLGELENLKLVVLSGGATASQLDALFGAGVKAVLATSVSRGDRAQRFAKAFYRSLANGRTVREAYAQADAFLQSAYDTSANAQPVVWTFGRGHGPFVSAQPWGLYVASEASDVLQWKLPSYRKIELPDTTWDHLLDGAPNAHIVRVLQELTRYNPDIYHQMVEVRDGETIRRDSRTFPEIVIRNFPWPVGSQIRLLQHYDGMDGERLEHLISAYLRTSQLLYYVVLSDLWARAREGRLHLPEGVSTGQPLTREEFQTFDFWSRTCELIREFREQKVHTLLPEFEELLAAWESEDREGGPPPLVRAHRHLEAHRRQLAAGPLSLNERVLETTERALLQVLEASAFLSRYRMLTVRNIGVHAPRFSRVAYDLDMGPLSGSDGSSLSLYRDQSHRRKEGYAGSGAVVLVRDENVMEDALNLSPFIVDKNTFVNLIRPATSEKDQLAHIFMLAYQEGDGLVYLSVDHSVQKALITPGDQIHTNMTRSDFTEGRNLGPVEEFDDFGQDERFGIKPSEPKDEPKVMGELKIQFDDFKADVEA